MATSRQRKVYVAILTLAVGGLALDKFVLDGAVSGPKSTLADGGGSAGDATLLIAQPRPEAPAVLPEQMAMAALSRRLQQATPAGVGFDSLPESFARRPPAAAAPAQAEAAAPALPDPPMISAVLIGNRPAVVAGGRPLEVGADVDGWTVVAIASDVVTFERGGQRSERRVR